MGYCTWHNIYCVNFCIESCNVLKIKLPIFIVRWFTSGLFMPIEQDNITSSNVTAVAQAQSNLRLDPALCAAVNSQVLSHQPQPADSHSLQPHEMFSLEIGAPKVPSAIAQRITKRIWYSNTGLYVSFHNIIIQAVIKRNDVLCNSSTLRKYMHVSGCNNIQLYCLYWSEMHLVPFHGNNSNS